MINNFSYFNSFESLAYPLFAFMRKGKFICVCPSTIDLSIIENDYLIYNELFKGGRKICIFNEDHFLDKSNRDLDITKTLLDFAKDEYLIILKAPSLVTEVADYLSLKKDSFFLKEGEIYSPHRIAEKLISIGYESEFQVKLPGEFALRGNILDIFSPAYSQPRRLDFLGDEIEEISIFDYETQRTIKKSRIPFKILTRKDYATKQKLYEFCSNYKLLELEENCLSSIPDLADNDKKALKSRLLNFSSILPKTNKIYECQNFLSQSKYESSYAKILEFNLKSLGQKIEEWLKKSFEIYVFCHKESGKDLFLKSLEKYIKLNFSALKFVFLPLKRGVVDKKNKRVFLCEDEVFARSVSKKKRKKEIRFDVRKVINNEEDIGVGDYAVHLIYGICIYRGVVTEKKGGEEFVKLEFAENKILKVSLYSSYLIQKLIQQGGTPRLNRLANNKVWKKALALSMESARDLAEELLHNEAIRKSKKGFSFFPDEELQDLFEDNFPYEESADQSKVIEEIKKDMEDSSPMERLLCGDVGFGKTEVLMRVAFKAVCSSKQVALLVPTTVLCQQHLSTFLERMADFPVSIEILCRFISFPKQKKTIKRLRKGKIDIIIGTHRLLQEDIEFRNLGLLIIDEEQRFGVYAKEKIKSLKKTVDVLSVSATPIPRTLYSALSGLKKISVIETPPKERKPVITKLISKTDKELLKSIFEFELNRRGKIIFLHNKIYSIEKVTNSLRDLVPEMEIEFVHGRQKKDELNRIMYKFAKGDTSVLVSTTIVESGLDIPDANTIIIDEAYNFSLTQLHQLRGRVGRSGKQAYCYLLAPGEKSLSTAAKKRISSIIINSHLGSGFNISMKDMELRGTGHILGKKQSGHVSAVGFTLYCQLLEESIASLRRRKRTSKRLLPIKMTAMNLDFVDLSSNIPKKKVEGKIYAGLTYQYIGDDYTRIDFYKRLHFSSSLKEVDSLYEELKDRFGQAPDEVIRLIQYFRIQRLASIKKIQTIETNEKEIFINKKSIIAWDKKKDKLNFLYEQIEQY